MKQDWTVQELLDWTKNYFVQNNVAEPRLEAEVLLACALDLDRIGLYVQHDRPVNLDERTRFREMIKRRISGEPTAYIVGQKEFMSLPFNVDSRVLIPRPDTEVLVEEAIRLLNGMSGDLRVADIGTGSGAIAVSIAHYVPKTVVWAVDIDPKAVCVAETNAVQNGVESRIQFVIGNLLEPVAGEQYDLIASNLPYIPSEEMSKLPNEVKNFEPVRALDGGSGGIRFYCELIPQAVQCLHEGGYLMMEISDQRQADDVAHTLGQGWAELYILKDLGGRERVVVARKGTHLADDILES